MLTFLRCRTRKVRGRKRRERVRWCFGLRIRVIVRQPFNGFRGTKDPLVGAEVVVRLIEEGEARWRKGVFWEWVGEEMRVVPW
jgi:hypothetical protein